jgi:hypothetical protein
MSTVENPDKQILEGRGITPLPANPNPHTAEIKTRYALEWRNLDSGVGRDWSRPGGGGFKDGPHSTKYLFDRDEALKAMVRENERWVNCAEHRVIQIDERVIGHACEQGRKFTTEDATPRLAHTPSPELVEAITRLLAANKSLRIGGTIDFETGMKIAEAEQAVRQALATLTKTGDAALAREQGSEQSQ